MPDVVDMSRRVHLVGSIPAGSAEEAMREAVTRLGDRLATLPDGETGERGNWVASIVESMRSHPDLEVSREGDFSDYDNTLKLRVRRNHKLRGETLDLGHLTAYQKSLDAFRHVCRDHGLDGLTFQVGVAGDRDMAMMAMGLPGMLRHRRAFTEATVAGIRQVHQRAETPVLFQIELPFEMVMVAQMPRPLRRAIAARLARGVVRLGERSPEGARFGIHLCLGDLGHRAFATPTDADPAVVLANAIATRWPRNRPLEFVHAPFAAAEKPAPLDPAFYAPLSRLRLPDGVRFVAGFVHENRDLDEHRRILSMIEARLGRQVDVATACGLGRRTPETAYHTMDLAAQLVAADRP
jgi:hypothetical protein